MPALIATALDGRYVADIERKIDAGSLPKQCPALTGIPTERQIAVWDRVFIRASRGVDRLVGFRIGKTLIAVWRKEDADDFQRLE